MNTFKNCLALITGGSSGIGLALARQLLTEGARIALLARNLEKLEQAREELLKVYPEAELTIWSADVANAPQVTALLTTLMERQGVPDLLINSAGMAHPGRFEELPLEIFDQMIAVNYLGTVYVTKAVVPAMLKRGSGHIVNISSVAGFLNIYGYTAYGAAKFAVRGFSDALRMELKPYGIQVSLVFPPDTDTPQLAYENQFKPEVTRALAGNAGVLSPDVVAREILRGIRRNAYLILPGFETKVIYLLARLLGAGVNPILDYLVRRALQRQRANQNLHRI
ncbi:SDR family oxidoreductase [uncultured Thermanaerothrix sp.]|uniref:SDR family oxidoreductase n=1 Tax=uncultured Thermanaerothrix sp. TaxID=1195149 RepID=UPI0026267585|nr:SDR family oxidoreductase [uncultured Thermanaerothrix sp.]